MFIKGIERKASRIFTESKFDEEGTLIEEGEFDLEKFQRALKERNINELTSGYQLEFIGKITQKQAGEHPTTVIVPNNDHNNLDENKKVRIYFYG